jgi:acylphosphatase
MNRHLHLFISGRVQGVYYRSSTRDLAYRLSLFGYVKNLLDGRVEITAEGDEKKLKELISWAREGPPGAEVRELTPAWSKYTGEFSCFEIR